MRLDACDLLTVRCDARTYEQFCDGTHHMDYHLVRVYNLQLEPQFLTTCIAG